MTKPAGERLSIVETKMDDLTLKVTEVASDVKEIKVFMQANYVVKTDFELRIKKIEEQSHLWRWLSPSLAAILGSVLTFLILEFLKGK
jgi:hypothetical protein